MNKIFQSDKVQEYIKKRLKPLMEKISEERCHFALSEKGNYFNFLDHLPLNNDNHYKSDKAACIHLSNLHRIYTSFTPYPMNIIWISLLDSECNASSLDGINIIDIISNVQQFGFNIEGKLIVESEGNLGVFLYLENDKNDFLSFFFVINNYQNDLNSGKFDDFNNYFVI